MVIFIFQIVGVFGSWILHDTTVNWEEWCVQLWSGNSLVWRGLWIWHWVVWKKLDSTGHQWAMLWKRLKISWNSLAWIRMLNQLKLWNITKVQVKGLIILIVMKASLVAVIFYQRWSPSKEYGNEDLLLVASRLLHVVKNLYIHIQNWVDLRSYFWCPCRYSCYLYGDKEGRNRTESWILISQFTSVASEILSVQSTKKFYKNHLKLPIQLRFIIYMEFFLLIMQ